MYLHEDEDFKDWIVRFIPPEILVIYHTVYTRQKHQVNPITEEEIIAFERSLNIKNPKKSIDNNQYEEYI